MLSSKRYIDSSSARTYSENSGLQRKQANEFVMEYASLMKGPILDVGCGTGELTAYFAKTFNVHMTGIDISKERISFANQYNSSQNVTFMMGDVTRLVSHPYFYSKCGSVRASDCQKYEIYGPITQYETVVSFNTFHHIPNHLQLIALKSIRGLLEDNGVALLLIPGGGTTLHHVIERVVEAEKWRDYFSNFNLNKVRTYKTAAYYKFLCRQAGFEDVIETESLEKGDKELTPLEMKDFIAGWLPQLAYLKSNQVSEKIQSEFLDEIVEAYFHAMKKSLSEKLNPIVSQNRIVAFAGKVTFFQKYMPVPEGESVAALRPRLVAKL